MYCRTLELWTSNVLPNTEHGVPPETIGTHTENVESRTVVFQGGGTYTYSGGRDIYFLTSLSRQGAPISLTGSHGGDITTRELIDRQYAPGTGTSGKKIPIKAVIDRALRIVMFTMQRVAGSQGGNQASRAHMMYALEAMAPMVFNCVEALLPIFNDQLTKC